MLIHQPSGQLRNATITRTATDETRAKSGKENKALQLICLKSKDKSKDTKRLNEVYYHRLTVTGDKDI
jgi:hypothetical protein